VEWPSSSCTALSGALRITRCEANVCLAARAEASGATSLSAEDLATLSYREALASARDRGSREYLAALLKALGGNVSRAAERAGLERESLHRPMRRHGIQASAFRESGRDEGD